MTYGVTESGFQIKSFSRLLEELMDYAKQKYGDNVDLSEFSVLLRFLEIIAKLADESWQLAENVYYSAYIDTASGESLDKLAALLGFKRYKAEHATGYVTFGRTEPATDDIIIPAGLRVATEDGSVVFVTAETVVLPSGETSVDAPIMAYEPGIKGNVPANTITAFVDAVEGIETVINNNPTTGGKEAESDAEFRYRIKKALRSVGRGTLEAIKSDVLNVEGVRAVKIEENFTNEDYTATGGLPPKSFRVWVCGGNDADIAQAIFNNKPCGIQPYGDVSVEIEFEGDTYTIQFSRVQTVDIYVSVTITTSRSVDVQAVKDAIKAYINNLDIGEDVVYNKVVAAVMSVDGVEDCEVLIDTATPPAGTSNIAIDDTKLAVTDDSKISVTI